jgi:hypothetical protein
MATAVERDVSSSCERKSSRACRAAERRLKKYDKSLRDIKGSLSFITKHWRGEIQIVGAIATVAAIVSTGGAALAGAGALADALDTTATVASFTAAATDAPGCVSGSGVSEIASCTGAITGGLSGGLGLASDLDSLTPTASDLLNQLQYLSTGVLGLGGGIGDWINAVNGSGGN